VLQQNNTVILKGEFLSRKDYIETLSLIKFYQDKISLQARCAPGLKQTLILQAESVLKKNGFSTLSIENANHRYFLEGVVTSPNELTKALSFVSDIIPNIENHVAIPIQINPSLNFRVFILELSRAAHESLGLSWNNLSPQFINFSNKNNFSFNKNFSATLKHLSSNGSARILSEPILSLRSGAEASVSAGGEIPLKITGQFDNRVVWKHYGLIIKIKVEGIIGNKIKTILSSESSELDEGTSVDGVPGIKKSELKTALDMEEGEVVLLTGVFRSTASKEIERFPVLGSIPILGELFKSRNFREHESELLIAVVPKFGAINPRLPLDSLHGLNFDKKWRLID
jgi:Flp pilus assembly secretin CpaC